MGTMQIGVPAGATGDGQGLPPATTPPPAPVVPQQIPTTYGGNHTPAKKRNKKILIIISSIVGLFVVAGIIFAIYVFSGNKTLSCEISQTVSGVTAYTEWTVTFIAHRADHGYIYQKMTSPTRIPNIYIDQYRKQLQKDYGKDYDYLTVETDGDKSIITEGYISVNRIYRQGKTYNEIKDDFIKDGYICKDQ